MVIQTAPQEICGQAKVNGHPAKTLQGGREEWNGEGIQHPNGLSDAYAFWAVFQKPSMKHNQLLGLLPRQAFPW
jgi:hypothetical protein